MNKFNAGLFLTALCVLYSFSHSIHAYEEFIVDASDDIEITVDRFPAAGKHLIIWLSPEYGFRETHRSFARNLQKNDIEVWQVNMLESLFLPQSVTSLRQLSGQYIADLIEQANQISHKKILIVGDSYASINALIGAYRWQQRKHLDNYFIGAILFSPYSYAYIPPLGKPPEFMPVISSTNIPLIIYQAKKSGNKAHFKTLVEKLQQHSNPVYIKHMPDIMSLFYESPPTKTMIEIAVSLSANIKQMISLIEKNNVPKNTIKLKQLKSTKSGIDFSLKNYEQKITPVSINLKNVNGNSTIKDNYKGQITIVNFWATWCPPCVEEIPSLNRLKSAMKDLDFELISINYAEDKKSVADFLKRVNVEYPVLLDNNGEFAAKWNVVAYPSTFIIDTKGKIRYGVNSAIEWDSPEIIKTLKSLYEE